MYIGEKNINKLNGKTKKFDDIDYCKNCDFLYEDSSSCMVNDPEAKVGHMLGTSDDFIFYIIISINNLKEKFFY